MRKKHMFWPRHICPLGSTQPSALDCGCRWIAPVLGDLFFSIYGSLATCQQPMVVPCSHEKFMRFRDFLPYPVCFFSLAQPYLNVSADPVPSFASLQAAPQEASAMGDHMIKDMGWRLFWEQTPFLHGGSWWKKTHHSGMDQTISSWID